MTKEEINRTIAEACGQKYHKPTESEVRGGSYYQFEPDYCGDLNTMHGAETVLPIGNQINGTVAYGNKLMRLCGTHEACIRATAAQRAEAFLRTIGKWREDEHPIADPPKVCDTPKQEEPK